MQNVLILYLKLMFNMNKVRLRLYKAQQAIMMMLSAIITDSEESGP